MPGEIVLDLIGHLTADPELRVTPSGTSVCSFTVAQTERRFDRSADEWVDGAPVFLRCTAWRDLADNIAVSAVKGSRVMVRGRLVQDTYETKDGEKRTVFEVQVTEFGLSCLRAVCKATKLSRHEDPRATAPAHAADDLAGARV